MKKSLVILIAVLLMVFGFAVAEECAHNMVYEGVVKEATCTTPAVERERCTICGFSDSWNSGSALGHNYEKSLKSEATCTEAAVYTFKCTRCGDSYTQSEGSALGHNYEKSLKSAATCTEAAVYTYTCKNGCGDSYNQSEGSVADHNHNVGVQSEATCDSPKMMYEYCDKCNTTLDKWPVGDKLNHNHNVGVLSEATCTSPKMMYEFCNLCNYVFEKWPEGDKLPHNFAAADCVTPATCTVCGETKGAALGHTPATRVVKAATCTEVEKSEDYCAVCGVILKSAYTSGDALGHDWYKRVVKPTASKRGYTEYACLACGEYFRTNYTDFVSATTEAVAVDVAKNPYGSIVTDIDDVEKDYTAELEEEGKHLCIVAKDLDVLRELHLSLALIEQLKAEGIEEICFVVDGCELVVPFAVLEGELIDEIKAAFPATMTGYIITLDPTAVNDEGVAGCLVKVDMTADTAEEDGIEMEITDVVTGMSLLLGETPITVVGGGVYTA